MRVKSALWRGILWGLLCALSSGTQAGAAYAAQAEPAAALAVVVAGDGASAIPGLDGKNLVALSFAFWPNAAPSLLLLADKTPRLLLPPLAERPANQLSELLAQWPKAEKTERCTAKDAVLKALDELKQLPQKPRLVLLLLNDAKAAPCELAAQAFRENDSRLLVVNAGKNEEAAAWQDLAMQSDGQYSGCAAAKDADACLFDTLKRINPALGQASSYFSLDSGTTKLSLFVRGKRGASIKLQSPGGPVLDLTSRLSVPNARETLAVPLFGGYALTVNDPPAGAWQVQNMAGETLWLMTEQKQGLEIVLPRRQFLDSESLPLAVYLSADGRIKRDVRKLVDVGCEARLFGLKSLSAAALAGAPLQDDGKAPDKVAGDGVYSGAVSLNGLLGPLTLNVSCQSSLFVGHATREIDVRHGDFLKRENAEQPLLEGTPGALLFAAEALPEQESPARYFMELEDEEPQALAEVLGQPGHYAGRLPALNGVGVYPLKLIAKRGETPLINDRQEMSIKLRVVADTEKMKTRKLLLGGAAVLVLLLAGAGFLVWRYMKKHRKAEPEQVLLEVPKAESLAEKPKAPEPETSAFMRIEEGDDVELPSDFDAPLARNNSKVFVEDVSQRISEVVSVHAAEPVKGEMERPTLDQQALDNDGDSTRVSGLMLEKVKTWLDKAEEAPEESAAEPTEPQEEGKFTGLNSDDMDEIFGAKKPPAGNADDQETK